MNIAVYCSSSNRIAEKYKDEAFDLGQWIAQNNHTLVYGGAIGGLMDAVAEGATSQNGAIIGVIATAIIRMNRQSQLPTELITASSMSERKAVMKEKSDLFVVLPGSFGTLDEMLDIVASGTVGEHKKPLIILNQDGFYNLFLGQLELMRNEKFMPQYETYKLLVAENTMHCTELINMLKSQ
jgi:TIGR00730 family protein